MAVSIGIDYAQGQWRVCRGEQGQAVELHQFESAEGMLATVRRLCAQYPEPTIVMALDVSTPFVPLSLLSDEQLERLVQQYHPTPAFAEIKAALQVLSALTSRGYCAPSVEYLPTVPRHRRLMRPALGTARQVCAVVALLHHMREQEAAWVEMNFFYLNAGESGTCALVISDGQIVNGIDPLSGSALAVSYGYLALAEGIENLGEEEQARRDALQSALDEAYWEGLTQELAGLLAVHHSEDVVVLGKQSDRLVERLADTQQMYLFPYAHTEREGYEAALGAALLGEGLEQGGSSGEIIAHLQLRQAEREPLLPGY